MSGISTEPNADSLTTHPSEDEMILLPGWPGYRTQPGRSGLDYIDTQLEMAHMAGIFLRQFFSGGWLRSSIGPHPLITLLVGIALMIAFPGSEGACLAVPVVLLIGLIAAIRSKKVSLDGQEPDEMIETAESGDEWNEDNVLEEGDGKSP